VPETGFSVGVMRTVLPCTDSGAGGDGGAGGGVFGGADTDVGGGVADRVVTSGIGVDAQGAAHHGLGADASVVPETGFSVGVMRTVFPCTESGAGGGACVDVGAGVGGDVFGGGDTDVEGGGADRAVTSGMAVGAEAAVDDGLGADVSLVPETNFSVGALPPVSLRAESDGGGDAGVAVGFRAKVSARATTLATPGSEGALFDVLGAVAAAGGCKFIGGARSSGV
jgi:hypothetical protein